MNWYLGVLQKYTVFDGRAPRIEYWMFNLLHIIILLIFSFIDKLAGFADQAVAGPLTVLYFLAVLIPGWAVLVRRLHDTGRSGWWISINAIPTIGWIILLVFLIQGSERGENKYGP